MPTPRLTLKPCAYELCGKLMPWRPRYRDRKYCDHACATAGRPQVPKEVLQANGRKGGRIRSAQRWVSIIDRYKQLAGTMEPWAAFKAGVRWQQKHARDKSIAALAEARRAGYSDGYEQGYDVAMQLLRQGVA